MNHPKPIQLSIPHPCTQRWDEMIPDGQGRHCAHCQKTVIDFTTWSDSALYQYFAKNKNTVCGHFFADQLDRNLAIPYQPGSRLYHITVAMGFTLLLAQPLRAQAQSKPAYAVEVVNKIDILAERSRPVDGIAGHITDTGGSPVKGALIAIYNSNVLQNSSTSNEDGYYKVDSLAYSDCDIRISHPLYDTTLYMHVSIFTRPYIFNHTMETPIGICHKVNRSRVLYDGEVLPRQTTETTGSKHRNKRRTSKK